MTTQIVEYKGAKAISFSDYNDAYKLAQMLSKTEFAPKNYRGKPEDITIAMLFGMEVGLPPMASVQNIAVVNGTPTIWGDGQLSLVQSSGLLKSYAQRYEGAEGTDDFKAIVEVERKDNDIKIVAEFSIADAKLASLWGKVGTWKTHPKRMLLYKARSFALRDAFPDVLKGLRSKEEMEGVDIPDTPETSEQLKEVTTSSIDPQKQEVIEQLKLLDVDEEKLCLALKVNTLADADIHKLENYLKFKQDNQSTVQTVEEAKEELSEEQ